MALTLKEFRELTKDLPEDMTINTTVEFGKENSIRGIINCVHIIPEEHSYAEGHITLTQHNDFETQNTLRVKVWEGKNKPVRIR